MKNADVLTADLNFRGFITCKCKAAIKNNMTSNMGNIVCKEMMGQGTNTVVYSLEKNLKFFQKGIRDYLLGKIFPHLCNILTTNLHANEGSRNKAFCCNM
uniref:Uncharacterized protein n=1 Tax=Cacopsylla melanoneura TaxID=428564 RepID=A0A8D8TVI0_9HEMI